MLFFTNCKKEEPEYILSLNVNTVNAGSVSEGGSYALGKKIIITATTNPGYTFKDWT